MHLKQLLRLVFAIFIVLGLAAAWILFGSATRFSESEVFIYVRTNQNAKTAVLKQIKEQKLLRNIYVFEWLTNRLHVWDRLPAGKYKLVKRSSLVQWVRKLRNRQQEPVDLVIVKLRNRQQFAALVARRLECDSLRFLNYLSNPDSLSRWNVDTSTLMAMVRPNTYTYYWSATPRQIFRKIAEENERFWTAERKQLARNIGLTPTQVITLASIVEEETNRHDEKPKIASVYLNRLKKGMFLGADPTVKFATGDFGLRRIRISHILATAQSPYNTYRHKGLPPGPICTPGLQSILAVLQPAATSDLYFCARPDGSGYHNFAATYEEHLKNARAYQQWFNNLLP